MIVIQEAHPGPVTPAGEMDGVGWWVGGSVGCGEVEVDLVDLRRSGCCCCRITFNLISPRDPCVWGGVRRRLNGGRCHMAVGFGWWGGGAWRKGTGGGPKRGSLISAKVKIKKTLLVERGQMFDELMGE